MMEQGAIKYDHDYTVNSEEIENVEPMGENLGQPPHKRSKVRRRHCHLCTNTLDQSDMKEVKRDNDKLVLVTEQMISSRKTAVEIRELLVSRKNIIVCRSHFEEAYRGICRNLAIKNIDDINLAPPSLLEGVVLAVNLIYENVTNEIFIVYFQQFFANNRRIIEQEATIDRKKLDQILARFMNPDYKEQEKTNASTEPLKELSVETLPASSNQSNSNDDFSNQLLRENAPEIAFSVPGNNRIETFHEYGNIQSGDSSEASTSGIQSIYCSPSIDSCSESTAELENDIQIILEKTQCSLCRGSNELEEVQSKDHKFVIVIGFILAGKFQVDRGSLILQATSPFRICHEHFKKSANTIQKFFSAAPLSRQWNVAKDCFMQAVYALGEEQLTFDQFKRIFDSFLNTYKKFLQTSSTQ